MWYHSTQRFPAQLRQRLVAFFFAQLLLMLSLAPTALAQIAGVNLVASCPAACGIKVRITSTLLRETPNGIDAVINWTLEQSAPEIKISSFQVTGAVEFKNRSKDETTISVSSAQREAVVRLTQSGRNKDIKFSDVTSVRAIVTAIAEALPPVPVTNIPTRKITGQGGDSAVEVTWIPPTPLPCSADVFNISVSAINEKGDRLTGNANASLSGRSGKVELKGSTNKKGLRNPEATVQVVNSLIVCQQTTNFTPKQEGFGSGTGSSGSSNSNAFGGGVGSSGSSAAKVTVKNITFREFSGRIDATVDWEVVEPSGFKATGFNLKYDSEDAAGKITVRNRTASGTQRSDFGQQFATGNLRSLAVTITATFRDTANTTVLTREDKKTQAFSLKQVIKPVVELSPSVKPVLPSDNSSKQPPPNNTSSGDQSLAITQLQLNREPGRFLLHGEWQIQLPAGVTVNTFAVENSLIGDQGTVTRTQNFAGNQRQGDFVFGLTVAGNIVTKAQLKITANLKRADGSSFQVTQLREVVPPGIPATPVGLSVTTVQVIQESTRTLVRGEWQLQLPAGVTIATFDLEATLIGDQRTVTRKGTFAGSERNGNVTFIPNEAGTIIKSVQLKVVANLKATDGSPFQQTATGNGN